MKSAERERSVEYRRAMLKAVIRLERGAAIGDCAALLPSSPRERRRTNTFSYTHHRHTIAGGARRSRR